MKYIGVGVSVLTISREFLSDRWQRVVVDGATRESIHIVSDMPQESVLGPHLFILYMNECLSSLRTDYIPIQMTSHFCQLFASQQTDLLLLLPPIMGTSRETRSGAIRVHDTES